MFTRRWCCDDSLQVRRPRLDPISAPSLVQSLHQCHPCRNYCSPLRSRQVVEVATLSSKLKDCRKPSLLPSKIKGKLTVCGNSKKLKQWLRCRMAFFVSSGLIDRRSDSIIVVMRLALRRLTKRGWHCFRNTNRMWRRGRNHRRVRQTIKLHHLNFSKNVWLPRWRYYLKKNRN